MNLKKLLITSALMMTVLLLMLTATSCSMLHEHAFSEWESVSAPTCTAFGLEKRACECGHIEYNTVDAVAHTPVADAAVDATCSANGKRAGSHCSVCGTVIEAQTETDKLAHSFSAWETVSEPTCTAFGLQKRACECGHIEYNTVDAVAHTPVADAAVDATCTSNGKTAGSHCGVCSTVIEAQTDTDKLAHSFSAWESVSAPTCTAFGLNVRACECGYTEYNTVDALGHNVVTDDAVSANCTDAGKTAGSHCDVCGVIITAQSAILPTGHCCDNVTVIEEAVCNVDGLKRFACSNVGCSYYYEESYALAELDSAEIFEIAEQYTGSIMTTDRNGVILWTATAFVISSDGIIVASELTLDNAYSAVFTLGDEIYEVTEVLAYNDNSLVAVLKIDATDLPCAEFCTAEPTVGETVYSVGVLGGMPVTMSSGIISNDKCVYNGANYILHDADMSSSYLGGPLINRFGEVIGINVGHIGDNKESLKASAWLSELESLDYSAPISVEEYWALTYTPTEQIIDWVYLYNNASKNGAVAYLLEGDTFYYTIGYNETYGYAYVEGYWMLDDIYELNTTIYIDNYSGTYQYYASLSDGMRKNEIIGYMDATTYTADTVLEYDGYYGRYWNEDELMAIYTAGIYDTVGWFSYILDTYFDTIDLTTFGFTSLSYERDALALDKLNNFVASYGMLDPTTGAYVLSMSSQLENDSIFFDISYIPASGDIPSYTTATVSYYAASGALFIVSLSLDPTDCGNRFDLMYAVYDGTQYVIQNVAWGYLDANSLTKMSTLSCYVFDGMNEYEDGLLADYKLYLFYLMDWIDYLAVNADPNISVKDLGFLFYYG